MLRERDSEALTKPDRSPGATRLLTVQEALRRLNIKRTKLWELRRAGKIRSAPDGPRRVVIDEASVERYIERLFENAT